MKKKGKSKQVLKVVPDSRLWERQPRESEQAYEAFCVYKDLVENKEKGGIREVGRRLNKSGSIISRWSIRWKWQERIRAYTNYRSIEQEGEERKALREQAKEWAKRKIDVRKAGFEAGQKLVERATMLLQLPVFEEDKTLREEVTTASGEKVQTVTVLNFLQNPRDARLFAETGIKLMRLSIDMSTENIGFSSDVDLDNMSPEDLDAYADELEELRKQSLKAGKV